MPAEIALCGFTFTQEEWLDLDDDTRELVAADWVDAFPYDEYEVVLEMIPGLN